ncbi:MAG: hypothetical protein CO090_05560 [Acidobacteria bacterium CG_4_9_14_3_um_filter_49_7]|nr:MAG: hypothetical protein CO090_05560 [Acidobacteria bacterium CG_4_9_14_3_um_filter_49_7]
MPCKYSESQEEFKMQVLDKRVLTVKMDGCKRPRRVYDILCEYFDVPHRGEIILEMEPYVAEDLQELVENVEKYNGETRNIAAELISIINGKSTDFDYIWLTY